MQVLNPEDVEKENKGIIIDGLRWYPRAEPLKMLRIFIKRLKQMIAKIGHVPDLAGAWNLILTRPRNIKLVDINNISRVSFDPVINLDDKGYPICDKSIKAHRS
jgi:hypothetical protein